MRILFEPWNLGDALIAASVARVSSDRLVLACNSRWLEVIRLASDEPITLLPLDLPYVWRTDKRFFSLGEAATLRKRFSSGEYRQIEVLSIRGDLRDWLAARRIFPQAQLRFTGWRPFLARKLSLFDRPFASGRRPVRNRYHAWAEATGIPFSVIEKNCSSRMTPVPDGPVVIHVGAQWKSKQYPHVSELVDLLKSNGDLVLIVAGPADPLPPGIDEAAITRPCWPELISILRSARCVITNDSGPMHLSAFLGCPTIALSRCSNIFEWLPPGATALSSAHAPRGYRPIPDYWSDRVLDGWPTPGDVAASLFMNDGF